MVTSDTVVLDCRVAITVSNLGLRDSCMYVLTKRFMYVCMYVCMYVWLNWLECGVGDWEHPEPSG